jgi:formylglycine-generating enzyme required for sulfatase activity
MADENRPDPPRPRPRRTTDVGKLYEALGRAEVEHAKIITTSIGLKLILVPAGQFCMGAGPTDAAPRLNEVPARTVVLTQPFYLGIQLVTQEQYWRLMTANPAYFQADAGGSWQHPVETVTWHDANEFCRRLSEKPEARAAGRVYRLPTEAEWEYACRAGTDTPFGVGAQLTAAAANCALNPEAPPDRTTAVGQYPANRFGLHDMHGNVWEWCADWYAANYYRSGPERNPLGPPHGTQRVVRGGSFRHQPATCRAAYRNALWPHHRDRYTGFRVALSVSDPSSEK